MRPINDLQCGVLAPIYHDIIPMFKAVYIKYASVWNSSNAIVLNAAKR